MRVAVPNNEGDQPTENKSHHFWSCVFVQSVMTLVDVGRGAKKKGGSYVGFSTTEPQQTKMQNVSQQEPCEEDQPT